MPLMNSKEYIDLKFSTLYRAEYLAEFAVIEWVDTDGLSHTKVVGPLPDRKNATEHLEFIREQFLTQDLLFFGDGMT